MINFPVASFAGNRPIEINIEISKQVIETLVTSAINGYFDRMEQAPASKIDEIPSPDLVEKVINLAKQVQGDNDALSAILGATGDDTPSA